MMLLKEVGQNPGLCFKSQKGGFCLNEAAEPVVLLLLGLLSLRGNSVSPLNVVVSARSETVLDSASHHHESIFDTSGVLGGGLDVRNVHALGELGSDALVDDTALNEICLVADEKLVDILASIAVDLTEPLLNVVEGLHISAVEHKDDTLCTTVVAASDGTETLLTGCIPNLELDHLAVAVKSLDFEVDTDGGDMRISPGIIGKTKKKATLSDTRITDQKDLEEIIMLCCACHICEQPSTSSTDARALTANTITRGEERDKRQTK